MIDKRIDSNTYKEEFKRKFENFGEKAPIVLSYVVDDFGVTVVHRNSDTSYFYEWDFSMDVKFMIHKIKQDLSANHYPRIKRKHIVERKLSVEEKADMIAQGTPVNEVPDTVTEEVDETYRIDKILALQDRFIIFNEATGEQYCYKMNNSSIFFLKNYREGKYKDMYEAGDAFFNKCTLVNKLTSRVDR